MVPVWAPDNALLFISDRTGWWNLYREAAPGGAAPLCPRAAEFGGPAWAFGARPFQTLPDGRCAGAPAPAAGALRACGPLPTDWPRGARRSQAALLTLGVLGDAGAARLEAHVCDRRLGQPRRLSYLLLFPLKALSCASARPQAADDLLRPQGGGHAAGRAGRRERRPDGPADALLRVRGAVGGAAAGRTRRARARGRAAHAAQRGRAAGGAGSRGGGLRDSLAACRVSPTCVLVALWPCCQAVDALVGGRPLQSSHAALQAVHCW